MGFTIAGTGHVLAALVRESSVGSLPVERFIVEAVRRWEFPKPENGGLVVVHYPFVLVAAGTR